MTGMSPELPQRFLNVSDGRYDSHQLMITKSYLFAVNHVSNFKRVELLGSVSLRISGSESTV